MHPALFTNRSAERDFITDAMTRYASQTSYLFIASAFFTDDSLIKSMTEKNGRVRLVVRLGFPTDPKALRRILGLQGVEVRYFTNPAFHPKLYIFGDQMALVGSANLTKAALLTNQEIMVSIPSDDERFEKLTLLFDEYWQDSLVLTPEALRKYEDSCRKFDDLTNEFYRFEEDIKARLGDIVSQNIKREARKVSLEDTFIEPFTKSYQECVTAFNVIKSAYLATGMRKVPEDRLPLRIEIDQFINYIREYHAKGESWMDAPIRAGSEQEELIGGLIQEWHNTDWPYLTVDIAGDNWPRLGRVFASAEAVKSADDDLLFEALIVLHSFIEGRRFKPGGLPALKTAFFGDNDGRKIRDSLSYLVFGKGSTIKRMYNMVYNQAFKLRWFGRASVQELVGWLNQEELPIINGRTTKVLAFLGFKITQLQ